MAAVPAFLAGLAMAMLVYASPGRAEVDTNLAKLGSWIVGQQLGVAAMVYFRNTGPHEKFFAEARATAKELGIDVKDFAPRPAKSTDGLVMALEYFSKGDGARISTDIESKYGPYHATLYDVAARMYQMALVYDLDPELGDKAAARIRSDCTKLKLPSELWKPAVDAVAGRAKFEDVKAAVGKMDQNVEDYLKKVARGEAR